MQETYKDRYLILIRHIAFDLQQVIFTIYLLFDCYFKDGQNILSMSVYKLRKYKRENLDCVIKQTQTFMVRGHQQCNSRMCNLVFE